MSQIRMQNHLAGSRADFSYQMDPSLQQEIKQVILTIDTDSMEIQRGKRQYNGQKKYDKTINSDSQKTKD